VRPSSDGDIDGLQEVEGGELGVPTRTVSERAAATTARANFFTIAS